MPTTAFVHADIRARSRRKQPGHVHITIFPLDFGLLFEDSVQAQGQHGFRNVECF